MALSEGEPLDFGGFPWFPLLKKRAQVAQLCPCQASGELRQRGE